MSALPTHGSDISRRRFLAWSGCAAAASLTFSVSSQERQAFPVALSEQEWRRRLAPEQYRVLREAVTEQADAGELLSESREGVYVCAACDNPLFSSRAKFDSGSNWPSFYEPIDREAISLRAERSWVAVLRNEVLCSRCGGYVGQVMNDGQESKGLHFRTNGRAMRFVPAQKYDQALSRKSAF